MLACRAASDVLDRVSAWSGPVLPPAKSTRPRLISSRSWVAKAPFSATAGFPGNICISLNEEVVHGIGGPRRIQYGDIVKLDIGVIKDGWVGDTATTVPVGIIDEKVQRLLP